MIRSSACATWARRAYAEKITIKAAIVASKPDALSQAQCAALALAGLTSLVSIEDTLQLERGEKILIQGGVAGFAIQLAKHIGACVVTGGLLDNARSAAILCSASPSFPGRSGEARRDELAGPRRSRFPPTTRPCRKRSHALRRASVHRVDQSGQPDHGQTDPFSLR
jgi:hypothetical protein